MIKIDFYRQRHIHRYIDATQKVNDVYQQSIEIIDYLHEQPTFKPILTEKNQDSVKRIGRILTDNEVDAETMRKTPSINNQPEMGENKLSMNFLFVYNSVTTVLRDHGII